MREANPLLWIGFLAGGFLLGSCMFSQLLPKLFLHRDICAQSDDHNPGCTNVFRSCGPVWGMLCLSLDLLKGFFPVHWAMQALDPGSLWFAPVLAAPVLGHAIAPLNHFRGGKCIATAFGALLGLLPASYIVFLLAGIYIVCSTVLKIESHRIRSIAVFGLFAICGSIPLIHRGQAAIALGCWLISATAIYKHCRTACCPGQRQTQLP